MTKTQEKSVGFTRKISQLRVGEGALIDTRAVCRDPDWHVRVSMLYDALPLAPLPPGISVAYLEKIKKRAHEPIFKIFYPKIENFKEIPMWEWPAIYTSDAVKISIINFLEETVFRSISEAMPEFPCRICKFAEQEKHDVCTECDRILRYFMGKCRKLFPDVHKMKIREQLIKRLSEI